MKVNLLLLVLEKTVLSLGSDLLLEFGFSLVKESFWVTA